MTLQAVEKFYGRRKGRSLKKQKTEFLKTLDLYRVKFPLDLKEMFPSVQEICLEIGFGGGEHLAALAEQNPKVGFIGAEAFMNGVASFLQFRFEKQLNNVQLFPDDVRLLLQELPDNSIQKVFILFPDPWPKKKHHKRRIVSPKLVAELSRIVKKGGEVRLASDVADYIEHMQQAFQTVSEFQLQLCSQEKPDAWPSTRYEMKALEAHDYPQYLIYLKN
ncbi:MAG: tRNA (guanosine(46)-N7)-methyltransferase TrmB [Candidatus Paracaedimonas acanthamoebae]|uniref:tRNA (guanine-N(7)-)-methyltransferase n=1 Tax=Candidatus Paracaedimonas acanthamoebae TaxID=244581 RepID=A0A8J7PSG5_9PROT|nr:tRNA (guanosine(46)-N7)-methyltransferase TrmB [Candidatus Paracaedimonas acanthamoebae]